MKNEKMRNRPLPKSFKDYALFCIKTNNVSALVKGLFKLWKIYIFSYARFVLRCHYCRKKHKTLKLTNDSKMQQMKKQRDKQTPIWW